MSCFDVVSDLKIGHIVEVAGTSIRVELSGDVSELNRTHEGRVYPIGQIGSVVKIHFGRQLVFGFVTLLRMRSEELQQVAVPIPPDADQRVMEVELFAEGMWNTASGGLTFKRGVTTYPLPRQGVYLLTRDETIMLSPICGRAAENGRLQSSGPVCFLRRSGFSGVPSKHRQNVRHALCHLGIDGLWKVGCCGGCGAQRA